jgi:hypothetical protein
MTLSADQIYALLPAIHRIRDTSLGEPLRALFGVIGEQVGVLEQDLTNFYADEFIETCAPWIVPYIGDLIGWTPLLPGVPGTAAGRAEVANTIGYRQRKGTVIALEQLGADVTGRPVRVIEYFRRLAVNQSFRHLRRDAGGYADLRDGAALARLGRPFETASRTADVRRIAPRDRPPLEPDTTALDIALHGPGRFNIPNIGAWVWRWLSNPVTNQPAFRVDARRFMISPLGADMALFNALPARTAFDHLTLRADVPQPISRREFHDDPGGFYGPGQGLLITAGGTAKTVAEICVCDLSDASPAGEWPPAPAGKVAIDPVRGRIAFPADQTGPVAVSYNYGFPAEMGGGPYDRTGRLPLDRASVTWQRVVGGGSGALTLAQAVAAFNSLRPKVGLIILTSFDAADIDLTGPRAITVQPDSQLWIVAAEPLGPGVNAAWTPIRARATLRGNIEITGASDPADTTDSSPEGQVFFSGILLSGSVTASGRRLSIGVQDCTLVPGRALTRDGRPRDPGGPSLSMLAPGAALMLERSITGPLRVHAASSARVTDSIVDATADWLIAFAGPDGASEGGALHVENSTLVGRVWTHLLPLASNTIFLARRLTLDPWKASVWCTRRQSGCVRFCFVPSDALTPRQYNCLPGAASLEAVLRPMFVTLRYGSPSYGLLSGDCPVAIWQGADDGSQIGAYQLLHETQGTTNYRTRLDEYLPFNLEAGIFLIPSRAEFRRVPAMGYASPPAVAAGQTDALQWLAIGAALI